MGSREEYLEDAGVVRLFKRFGRNDLNETNCGNYTQCSLCNTGQSGWMSQPTVGRLLKHWDSFGHLSRLEAATPAGQLKQLISFRADIEEGYIRLMRSREATRAAMEASREATRVAMEASREATRVAMKSLGGSAHELLHKLSYLMLAPSWRWHIEALVFRQVLLGSPSSDLDLVYAVKKYERRERAALLELALIKFVALRRGLFISVHEMREQQIINPTFNFTEHIRQIRFTEVHRVLVHVVPWICPV